MRLDYIHLQNWQPFRGRGIDSKKLDMRGKSGLKNLITYAPNTHGKTAIWQAIQFGLYGKVNKRKTGWEDGKFKPWIADNTAAEPLLNQTANEEGDYVFGVIMGFNHGGDDYMLERTVEPRSGVSMPRYDRDMQEAPLYIRNETQRKIVKEPQNFINDILPFDLAQFFMFDGERLDDYRKLFEEDNDVKLKSYIEAILRFPVLTAGTRDFEDLKKRYVKENRKFNLRSSKDTGLTDQIKHLQETLDELVGVIDSTKEEKDDFEEDLLIVEEWLRTNDKGAEALVQQDLYQKQISGLEEKIEQAQKRLSRTLPDSWRAIISSRIEVRLEDLDSEIERQRKETERIKEIEIKIKSLNNKLNGKACQLCGHVHDVPPSDEKDNIHSQIIGLETERDKLEETRIDPDPHDLLRRHRALWSMKSNTKLNSILDLEKDIVTYKQDIRDAEELLKSAMKLLTNKARREVQEYLSKQDTLKKNLGALEDRLRDYAEQEKGIEIEIKKREENLQSSSSQTLTHKKVQKKIEVLEELISIWSETTDIHRENMRARVEKNASKLFLSLTNKKKSYKGLKIHTDFRVEILHKKKTRGSEAGSGGQSALMAYSILDALTRSSGIEFPMVVDTPSRSVDPKNLERLFDYLLLESGKQVIILPHAGEIEPETGDERYGGHCAATYEIKFDPESEFDDLSILEVRVKNWE